jgi:hypothetical protein
MKDFHRKTVNRKNQEQLESPLETALAAIFMALTIAGMIAFLFILDAASVTPETRCFSNAIGQTYCRTQSDWGAS